MIENFVTRIDFDRLAEQVDKLNSSSINILFTQKSHELMQNNIVSKLDEIKVCLEKYQENILKRLKILEDNDLVRNIKAKNRKKMAYWTITAAGMLSTLHFTHILHSLLTMIN